MARRKALRSSVRRPTRTSSLEHLHIWQIQAVRDVLLVAAVFGLLWLGYALRTVTVPLLIALLLAYLFEPLIVRLSRIRHMSRVRAVGGLIVLMGMGVALVLAILVPLLVGEISKFVDDVSSGRFRDRVETVVDRLPNSLADRLHEVVVVLPGVRASPERTEDGTETDSEESDDDVADSVSDQQTTPTRQEVQAMIDASLAQRAPPQVVSRASGDGPSLVGLASEGVSAIWRLIGTIISWGLVTFLIPFYFFFFSISYPSVVRFGRGLIPHSNRTENLRLISRMDRVVAGFVRGRIVISLIMGTLFAIGWSICGVPYALLIGLVVGVFSAVPYLGGVGIPLAIGMLGIHQLSLPVDERMAWWLILLGPTLVFAIVQVIETYGLTPVIAGKMTNLDPVTIVVAVLAGGSVLGVYGMLLAIPAAACGKILFTDVLLPRIKAWTRGEVADPLPIERD